MIQFGKLKEDIWRGFGQFEKSRMLEIDIFWFSQYSAMGPLEAILTPKRSQTQAETHFKVFLVRFYIGPQNDDKKVLTHRSVFLTGLNIKIAF